MQFIAKCCIIKKVKIFIFAVTTDKTYGRKRMYHIIANPKAGDKKVARLLKRTLQLLTKAGAEYT